MQPNLMIGLIKRDSINAYTNWMASYFLNHIQGNVIDVGAGIGDITNRYINKSSVARVLVTDIFEDMLAMIQQRFDSFNFFSCVRWNIEYPAPAKVLGEAPFNTIVCVNVLEHIENDFECIKQFYDLLSCQGKLVLLVPAHQFLYGGMDKASGHYRRYERKQLLGMLSEVGFNTISSRYMNFFGTIPWFISGRVLKVNRVYSEHLSEKKLKLVNILAPILQVIEKWFIPPIGLSLIVVAEKPN